MKAYNTVYLDELLESIVVYAERYALGRSTYAVSDVCTFIIVNLCKLETKTLKVIHKDINSKIETDGIRSLGMDMDQKQWLRLDSMICLELEDRENE